jgi:hypothetical protein
MHRTTRSTGPLARMRLAPPRNRGALSVGFSGGFQLQAPGRGQADREWTGERSPLGPPPPWSIDSGITSPTAGAVPEVIGATARSPAQSIHLRLEATSWKDGVSRGRVPLPARAVGRSAPRPTGSPPRCCAPRRARDHATPAGRHPPGGGRGRPVGQDAHARHLPGLLRLGGERCAEKRRRQAGNEGSPIRHSIT